MENNYSTDTQTILKNRLQLLEGETKVGDKWPLLIIIINVILWIGTVPTMVMLAIFEAGKQPSFAKDVTLPSSLWVINSLQFFANLFGAYGGYVLKTSSKTSFVKNMLTAQIINVLLAVVMIILQVVAVVQFQSTKLASDHPWTIAIFSIYSVYQSVLFVIWGVISYGAFTLREFCKIESSMGVSPINHNSD